MFFKPQLESLEDRLTPSNSPVSPPGFVEAHAQVTVMQQNIDEGTDFLPLLFAVSTGGDIAAAVSATFAQVQASDIPGRMQLLADEIAAGRPDLAGLQESTVWSVNGVTRYDLLGILLTDLAAEGQHYGVVVKSPETPTLSLPDAQGNIISFQDSNVILARTDLPPGALRLSNVQEGQYAAHLSLPLPGVGSIPLTRSWASVDVQRWGERFRFITTHLETLSSAVTEAQTEELLAGPANTSLRVILTGDFNATPDTGTYSAVVGAGFLDAWTQTHPVDPGYTWGPTAETTRDFNQRIDYVFANGGIQVESATLLGTDPAFHTDSGLYPSDHLGLLVTFNLR